MAKLNYRKFIEENFDIINKDLQRIPFLFNHIQTAYNNALSRRDIILKSRQEGFSSLLSAIFTTDFLIRPNSVNVIVADNDENAEILLTKVKLFLNSYETKNNIKIPLKYNSKTDLTNELANSTFSIGTAKNTNFGRSRTMTNLLLTEVARYPDIEQILAGAGQAVVESGRLILETTANGFNNFKRLWTDSKLGMTGFNPLFFKASDFYSPEFLAKKKLELKEYFCQEYPETDTESFLSSGECYFDLNKLKEMYLLCWEPKTDNLIMQTAFNTQ